MNPSISYYITTLATVGGQVHYFRVIGGCSVQPDVHMICMNILQLIIAWKLEHDS